MHSLTRVSLPAAFILGAACGGGDDSAAERICEATQGCGGIGADEVDECITELEADRAKDECATCLESSTCGEIDGGACASDCSTGSEQLPRALEAAARELCQFGIIWLGATVAETTECTRLVVAHSAAELVNECNDCLDGETCASIDKAACTSGCQPVADAASMPWGRAHVDHRREGLLLPREHGDAASGERRGISVVPGGALAGARGHLAPGDFLYSPARWWHMADSQQDSLSISVGVMPSTLVSRADYLPAGRRGPSPA